MRFSPGCNCCGAECEFLSPELCGCETEVVYANWYITITGLTGAEDDPTNACCLSLNGTWYFEYQGICEFSPGDTLSDCLWKADHIDIATNCGASFWLLYADMGTGAKWWLFLTEFCYGGSSDLTASWYADSGVGFLGCDQQIGFSLDSSTAVGGDSCIAEQLTSVILTPSCHDGGGPYVDIGYGTPPPEGPE